MPDNSDMRDCIVKLRDGHGVEHSVEVREESVYEAALRGLERLNRVGWESDGSQIGTVVVEVYEEPTTHTVNVKRLLEWLKQPGKSLRSCRVKIQDLCRALATLSSSVRTGELVKRD